ncbi:26S proteasome regulatory subunit rpn10-related protein [Trichomonas vaginalis G3]|uniref:26S proteasome regulatory subunit rpn10-related protein n=1 Tax=Trichomonas vaginalis (strain ATCC PRA-98 / G3) TaxID=412133 RepID=A2FWK5_TRIV3|nr:proteasome assembly [Trichomonas vaginalis G3]EAX90715.1 26S proteasome regulatory subunit rpn10-related protein [Trichomonas vaginalis G3]KAI5507472.1 proteasome assembly [Trichomonas vaginalis G3]|eukprot:XP_001303645.1 26S proteasome regulatory subunit rpn10-related protein [Trichomonas vaginalis G3]
MAYDEPEAIIFLIDNSDTSINGDFDPSRLDAQKLACERLASYNLKQSPQTEIAIGSIGSECFGIQQSLLNTTSKLHKTFDKIYPGGEALVTKGLLCAMLALKYASRFITSKRIVLFLGSKNNLTNDDAKSIIEKANDENISIDIIAFGTEVDKLGVLEMITRYTYSESFYIRIRNSHNILSDSVLSSVLGPGSTQNQPESFEEDDELTAAIKASLEDSDDNDFYNTNEEII